MADAAAPYGYCPECGAAGVAREKRVDGNTICANHHTCPSAEYRSDPSALRLEAEVIPKEDRQPEVSLNAGAELEEKHAQAAATHEELFGDFTPGEIPELKKEVVLIEALEAQLQDLSYLREDLLRSRGMSQSFALEAQRLLPGFDGAAPVGFYTVEPSATRYQVALEELSRGMWAAIAALSAAILALIAKLVAWFLRRHSEAGVDKQASDKAAAAKENLHKLEKTEEQLRDALHDVKAQKVHTLRNGEPEKLVTMTSVIEDTWTDQHRYEHAMKFLRMEDPVLRDIVQGGEYSQLFRQLANSMAGARQVLQLKAKELEKVVRIDRNSFQESDRFFNEHMLQLIGKPISVHLGGHEVTLDEAADQLSRTATELRARPVRAQPLQIEQVMAAAVQAYRASGVVQFFEEQADVLKVLVEIEAAVKRMKEFAGDLSKDGAVGHNSEGMAGKIREVLLKVSKDLQSYRRLFTEMSVYGEHLDYLAVQARGFANEIEDQLYALARRGQLQLPDGWQAKSGKKRVEKISSLFGQLK